jgi:flagellar export protein FliJ
MGFQFSLATVLQVRGILEQREERMLQTILSEIARTGEAIAHIDAAIARADAARRENLFKPSHGHNLHAAYGEVKELQQNRKNLEERSKKLEQLRDKQLKIYKKARQNREMLTDIREEQQSAYETEMARLEQKNMDDIFISRRRRN